MKYLSKEVFATEQIEEDLGSTLFWVMGANIWLNKEGKLYRLDGPCYEEANSGYKEYRQSKTGATHLHREDGPAVIFSDGTKEYWLDGKKIDPKDFIVNDPHMEGDIVYWKNAVGELHNPNGPSLVCKDGTELYSLYGKAHREDGPAAVLPDRTGMSKEWWVNGKRHREDGPALERSDGYKEYWIRGKKVNEEDLSTCNRTPGGDIRETWKDPKGNFHRVGGPAVWTRLGSVKYYYHGKLHNEDGPAIVYYDGIKLYFINGEKLSEADFNAYKNNKTKELNNKLEDLKKSFEP